MRTWSTFVAAALILAGCAEPTEPEIVHETGVDETGNQTLENAAPVASLQADVLNGTAPLAINFTIDASDADGDNLTWAFSVNGTQVANGTDFPATLGHTFGAGNHTVVLDVHDGNATNATRLLVVAAAPVQEVPSPEPIEHSGWITIPCNQCYWVGDMDLCTGLQSGTQEIDCVWFELPEEAAGRDYTTSSSGDDADIAFYSSCEAGNQIQFVGQTGHDAGIVPEGAGCVVMVDWLMPDSELSIRIV